MLRVPRAKHYQSRLRWRALSCAMFATYPHNPSCRRRHNFSGGRGDGLAVVEEMAGPRAMKKLDTLAQARRNALSDNIRCTGCIRGMSQTIATGKAEYGTVKLKFPPVSNKNDLLFEDYKQQHRWCHILQFLHLTSIYIDRINCRFWGDALMPIKLMHVRSIRWMAWPMLATQGTWRC